MENLEYLEGLLSKLKKGLETDQRLFLIVFNVKNKQQQQQQLNTFFIAKNKLESICQLLTKFGNSEIINVIDLGVPDKQSVSLISMSISGLKGTKAGVKLHKQIKKCLSKDKYV